MKKVLIYFILSIVIMVPIVAIIVVSILAQPSTTYSEHVVDDTVLITDTVKKGKISEVITTTGLFETSKYVEDRFNISGDVESIIYKNEGDYAEIGDVLGYNGNSAMYSDTNGIITDILEESSLIVFRIKSCNVDRMLINVPNELFDTIDKSSYSMYFNEATYKGEYISCESVSKDNCTFPAYYKLEGNGFVLGGTAEVNLKTGYKKDDALLVKKECIRKDEKGNYYIEVCKNDDVERINIKLGIIGANRVEIIAAEDGDIINEGMKVSIGEKNIFLSEYTDQNDRVDMGTSATEENVYE